ncbi:MAG: tRNA threonylcarbamoyladenosine dehydratase [Proteobacteria bacterium]|nr:tRNA threonylcarbamoyladenosine dehydratase [Pseudomonadota bacterium]MBU1584232.1 tRNA threonylcarbamoyladenosine dehydratase [Pseudomonadota bacterium]MBU2455234.1 tRNA threonylcarbamoyladenosine dehydratase [Pseudomonadota bacterium]MBU2629187.1 tRNA threonylcarbamoyladenosine dehydratase [Pseudomonadota bacterium]
MNQFARTEQLLGAQSMEKIKKATVAVFGLGAVGSFVTEALARSGVGNLRLIDFDRVDVSNINRQLFALHSTIGRQKAKLAHERVKDINPQCNVTILSSFVNAQSLEDLLSKDIDVVVDAIDGLNSKINLIVGARQMNLPVVSSMGAGGRTDVSMIRTGDISETSVCPLARVVRQRLHRRGLYKGIRAVYSIEKPLNKQPYKSEDAVDALSGHGRSRPPIGTVAWIPGVFGLTIASEVIHLITRT